MAMYGGNRNGILAAAKTVVLVSSLFSPLFSYTLTGTVTDTAGTPLQDVRVILTGLSVAAYCDTTKSDPSGYYEFVFEALGSYRVTLARGDFYQKDTTILLPEQNTEMNFTLKGIPGGTYHEGIVSGVWLPSENPHRITQSVTTIDDSLYIAPGCTVLSDSGTSIKLEGSLTIGSSDGERTSCVLGGIDGDGYPVTIENASLTLIGDAICDHPWIVSCSTLTVTDCDITASNSITVSADSIQFTAVSFSAFRQEICKRGGYETRLRFTGSTLVRFDSSIVFSDARDMILLGDKIVADRTIFEPVTGIQSEAHIRESKFTYGLAIKAQSDYHVSVRHSLIGNLEYYISTRGRDTIIDNIITDNIIIRGSQRDTLYTSPFSYNIFGDTVKYERGGPFYLGLLDYLTVNANGDSCDMWHNMKTDYLLVDLCSNSVGCIKNVAGSKALHAGSNGSNIGPDQDEPIAVKEKGPVPHSYGTISLYDMSLSTSGNHAIVAFHMRKAGYVSLELLDMRGKSVRTVAGSYFSRGKHRVAFPTGSLAAGAYVCRFRTAEHALLQKLTVIR